MTEEQTKAIKELAREVLATGVAKLVAEVADALSQTDEQQYRIVFGRNPQGELELTLHDMDTQEQVCAPVIGSEDVMTNEIRAEDMVNKILYA